MEPPLELVTGVGLDERGGDLWFVIVRDGRGVSYGVPCVPEGNALRRAVPGDGAAEALLRLLATAGDEGAEGSISVTRW